MEQTKIEMQGNAAHGQYTIDLPGISGTARLSWTGDDKIRIAQSTYVPPSMRGQGIAGALVRKLAQDARDQGFLIVPRCSYVEAAFKRRPEWQDLLAP